MTTPVSPDELQQADIIPIRILVAVGKNSDDIEKLRLTIQALNDVLASHIRTNLETLQEVREYIGNQLNYRLLREDMEEQRLRFEIDQKNLDLQLMEKRVDALMEENLEADQLRVEVKKAKLEVKSLRDQLELVKTARDNTNEKMKALPTEKPKGLSEKLRETMVLTAASVATASVLGGILAFLYWGLRQWILSATP